MFNVLLKEDLEHIFTSSESFQEQLSGKSIFISGGTGFFGKWILEAFAWANIELSLNLKVVILTRSINNFRKTNEYFFKNKLFSFIEGDISNFIYPEDKFDYIIHGATDSNSDIYKTNSLLLFDTILEGTRHILDFATKCDARSFLFISSGAVYGKQPTELLHLSEEYTGGPPLNITDSSYSEGKRAAELFCSLYSSKYGVSVKIARCFAFVGPYLPLNKHFAIGNFINDCLENKPIIIKGDGTPVRSYLYSADLVIWLLTILLKGENCRPYNVGSEHGITIENLAKTISAFAEKPIEIKILTGMSDQSHKEKYLPSTMRAQKELGLAQTIDMNDSIRRTLNYYRALTGIAGI